MAAVAVAVRNKRKQVQKEWELQQAREDAISRAGSDPGSEPNPWVDPRLNKLRQISINKVNTTFRFTHTKCYYSSNSLFITFSSNFFDVDSRWLKKATVWKFHDFAISLILREINFGESRSAKFAIFTFRHSEF